MVLGQSSASAHLVVTCWCRLFLSRITPSAHHHSVTSHSLQLTPVCPALAQYTIHSVDMLKRANSDKINPCIYLYDNIKLDLLKLCRVLIAIWYLDNTLMLEQTFLPTANTIRIQFRLISHFCPDPREDVSKCQISFVLDIWDEATRIKRFLNLNDIFTSTSIFWRCWQVNWQVIEPNWGDFVWKVPVPGPRRYVDM